MQTTNTALRQVQRGETFTQDRLGKIPAPDPAVGKTPQQHEPTATGETARRRRQDVRYWSGRWEDLQSLIPKYTLNPFSIEPGAPSNPNLRTVVREPRTPSEERIPVGVVSKNYSLVQHRDIVEECFNDIQKAGIEPSLLRCELGLTEFGEWMNFRVYFPESYRKAVGANSDDTMDLRLECLNSVDGHSRLLLFLGWFRLVCLNGMIIGKLEAVQRAIHEQGLTPKFISGFISEGLSTADKSIERFREWQSTPTALTQIEPWVNSELTNKWGKKAACRVFNICRNGTDVEIKNLSVGGQASQKQVRPTVAVPGSPNPAKNLFDVSQALSWIATQRNDPNERVEWQGQIPPLIEKLLES